MPRSMSCITLLCLVSARRRGRPRPRPPFTATEMMKLKRLADPQLAPDGVAVAYALTEIDLDGARRGTPTCGSSPLSGGEPRRLTSDPKASDTRPRFSPDGKALAFLSTRDGSSQVWRLELAGGEPRKLTSLATGVDALRVAGAGTARARERGLPRVRRGRRLQREEGWTRPASASSARVYDELLYRHWDTWDDGRRSHVLSLPLDGGAAVDLTPGGDDAPPFNLGGEDWGVSPDGSEVCVAQEGREDRGLEHERRAVPDPRGGRRRRRRSPTRPATTAAAATARTDACSPIARSCAPATSRTAGGSCVYDRASGSSRDAHRGLRPPGRRPRSSRPTRRRSTSPPRTTASRPSSRCRSRAAPSTTCSAEPGHSATSR